MNIKYLLIALLIGLVSTINAIPSGQGLVDRAAEAKEDAAEKADDAQKKADEKSEEAKSKIKIQETEETEE